MPGVQYNKIASVHMLSFFFVYLFIFYTPMYDNFLSSENGGGWNYNRNRGGGGGGRGRGNWGYGGMYIPSNLCSINIFHQLTSFIMTVLRLYQVNFGSGQLYVSFILFTWIDTLSCRSTSLWL